MKIISPEMTNSGSKLDARGRRTLAAAEATAARLSGFAAFLTRIGAGH